MEEGNTPTTEAMPSQDVNKNPDIHSQPISHGWRWIASAWSIFTKRPGLWVGIMLVWFLATFIISCLPLGSLLYTVVAPVFGGGILLACRDCDHDEDISLSYIFKGFRLGNTDQLFIVGLIYLGLMFLAFIPIFVSTGLFIFSSAFDYSEFANMDPAAFSFFLIGVLVSLLLMFPILMMYWFAPALVVFHEMEAFKAMISSFKACLKNILPLTLYSLIGIVLMIIASIPLGLGLLVLMPIFLISMYTSYQDIYTDANA